MTRSEVMSLLPVKLAARAAKAAIGWRKISPLTRTERMDKQARRTFEQAPESWGRLSREGRAVESGTRHLEDFD